MNAETLRAINNEQFFHFLGVRLISLTRDVVNAIILQQTTLADAIKVGRITVNEDASKLEALCAMLDTFKVMFPGDRSQ